MDYEAGMSSLGRTKKKRGGIVERLETYKPTSNQRTEGVKRSDNFSRF